MSSLKSVQTPPAADAAQVSGIIDAIVVVAERSFFAFAEPAAPDADIPGAGDRYELAVAFTGPFAGIVRLTMPVTLAHDLCAAFSGAAPDEAIAADAVQDLAGEFANMACGTWLTGLGESVCFSLAHPMVRAAGPEALHDGRVVLVNDQPVVVGLELVP